MNFTVDRDLLIDVLTGIQGVAERRHTMPVLSHCRLAGLPSQEFPEMPEKPSGKTVSIDGDIFRKLSERVVPFASSDETRYNLAGILLEGAETESGRGLR